MAGSRNRLYPLLGLPIVLYLSYNLLGIVSIFTRLFKDCVFLPMIDILRVVSMGNNFIFTFAMVLFFNTLSLI